MKLKDTLQTTSKTSFERRQKEQREEIKDTMQIAAKQGGYVACVACKIWNDYIKQKLDEEGIKYAEVMPELSKTLTYVKLDWS